MPFVRNLTPAAGPDIPRPSEAGKLVFTAVTLSALCALAAFLFFVLRDQSQVNVMVNYQQRSVSSPHTAPSTVAASGALTAGLPAPANGAGISKQSRARPEFTLARSNHFESVGPLQVKLVKTDPSKHTYDLTGMVGGRSFTHRNVRVNEPVWIGINRRVAPVKFVAESIGLDQISGYWTQTGSLTPLNSRRHSRRR